MNNKKRKDLRWKIFKLFGPPEIQQLIDYIDSLTQDGSDIVIIPTGEFEFSIKISTEDQIQPMIFETRLERAAFQAGMNYGIGLLGGSTTELSKEEYDTLEFMEKKSTHSGGSGNLN